MRILALLLLAAALADPPQAESCGPFLPAAQFSYVSQPPQDVFARGRLGILRPAYYRRYLVVAYRYLAGAPLNPDEIAAFSAGQSTNQTALSPASLPPSPVEQWLTRRNKVPGVGIVQSIDQFRYLKKPDYVSYQNCLDDAFVRAARTLGERTATWGAASPLLKEWVRGQDAVFGNCNAGDEAPPDLPIDADSLLAADHRYQTAASEFYAEHYEAAGKDFAAIALDAGSPWRDIGEYMVARTLIREATIAEVPEKMQAAGRVLDGILANPQLAGRRASAQALREFVRVRLDPDREIQAMSERLMHSESGPEFARALTDFTLLCDTRKTPPSGGTELVDWISTFQARSWEHAVERWRAHPNDAWLIAALASIPHDSPAVRELLDASARVPPASPAWASAVFYGISLEIERGETDGARKWADEAIMAAPADRLGRNADERNQFLAERLALARNWEDFLRFAARAPVAVTLDVTDEPIASIYPLLRNRKALLDADFTVPLNSEVPLVRWSNAASSPLLPAALQADIAQAGWVRAMLLDRIPEARALASRLAELRPQLRAPLGEWLNQKDAKAAKFQAVLLLLRIPAFGPIVRDNFGRETGGLEKIDQYRDNWWDLTRPDPAPARLVSAQPPLGSAQFLPAAERAAGQKEWAELKVRAPQASDYLCGETVAWARAHPDDPRVPEALHLAIRATRFTSGQHTTTFPKQAFTLLHTRYPDSKWTALTPYWF